MEWKSNARYDQPLESGSIYALKPKGHISVHRIHGLGNDFYLSCPPCESRATIWEQMISQLP